MKLWFSKIQLSQKELDILAYLDELRLPAISARRLHQMIQKNPGLDEYGVSEYIILKRLAYHRRRWRWYQYRCDLVMLSSNAMQARRFEDAVQILL